MTVHASNPATFPCVLYSRLSWISTLHVKYSFKLSPWLTILLTTGDMSNGVGCVDYKLKLVACQIWAMKQQSGLQEEFKVQI